MPPFPLLTDSEILAARPDRNVVQPDRPYAFLVEPERNAEGEVLQVATLFLSNSECPFRCLYCDLWKNTLDRAAPSADIPAQIRFALAQLPEAQAIKLYNSGNFFDAKAIPPSQHPEIADLVRGFSRVIVENHPRLTDARIRAFRDLIAPAQLEIAMGLETCHPELLQALNKEMTLADFDRAANFCLQEQIALRAFILLKPPFLDEEAGVEWCLKSIDYAFSRGVNCCSVIATRGGNGIMEQLSAAGQYAPPQGASLETVLAAGIARRQGRVFMDLWETEPFFTCDACRSARLQRLAEMNLSQEISPPILCNECAQPGEAPHA